MEVLMPRLDPYESLGFLCNLTFKAFVSVLEHKLKGTRVSRAQFLALAHLTGLGPLSQRSLSDFLSITPATTVTTGGSDGTRWMGHAAVRPERRACEASGTN